jgi:hypothetical protein
MWKATCLTETLYWAYVFFWKFISLRFFHVLAEILEFLDEKCLLFDFNQNVFFLSNYIELSSMFHKSSSFGL